MRVYSLLLLFSACSITAGFIRNAGFEICESKNPDVLINVTTDLKATPDCGTCLNLFGEVSAGFEYCMGPPCDGLMCHHNKYAISLAGPQNPKDSCIKDNLLLNKCTDCDSDCYPLCNLVSDDYSENELVVCGFDLTGVGTSDNSNVSVCTGTVPASFCDDAVAVNRTCFVGRVERDVPSISLENCAPVFASVRQWAYRTIDYWACPMNVSVLGSVYVYDIPREYCSIFETRYGDPLYPPVEIEESSNSSEASNTSMSESENAGARVFSWLL
jgi:hypothetical protein